MADVSFNTRFQKTPNQIKYQYPTLIYRSPIDVPLLLLNEQLISLLPVVPFSAITLIVPNEFSSTQNQCQISLAYSARFIAEDASAQRAAMEIKFVEYGNIRNGNQPIKIDGAPLDPSFTDTQQKIYIQSTIHKLRIDQIEAYIKFQFDQLASNPVFTPDPAANSYVECIVSPVITVYGTN